MIFNFFKKDKTLSPEDQISEWNDAGKPAPPPHIIKQRNLTDYQQKYNLNILVETGTFLGDMVEAQLTFFKIIYSIELSEQLHKKAAKRFQRYPHVKVLQGDSGIVLNNVVSELIEPALFWLDGHYSGGITALGSKECPVPEELHAILRSPLKHVLLIDDARLFNGTQSYPTLEDITAILKTAGKNYSMYVEDDIIRLIPD